MSSTGPDGPLEDPDELVQMNVRVPRSLRDRVDARRAQVGANGLSRDKWVTRALTWALAQPKPTSRPAVVARTATGRTARSRRQ